jgi:hypothetical protein
MNGTAPKIEIIAPLSQSMELMRRILFRPFNLEKWLVIGFAAFLAHLGGGGRFNFNFPSSWRNHSWRPDTWTGADFSTQMPGWFWPLMFVVVPLGIALAVLLAWIGSRGRFIFTDCIVRDRGAIVVPWHEYRKEGNSLFIFTLGVALVLLALFAIGVLPLLLPSILHHRHINVTFTLGLVFWLALLIVAALAWWIISQFMVPVMYRQRCSAWSAFHKTVGLITAHAGEVILFVLFLIVITIALGVAVLLVGVLTCCVGLCLFALPYVGTVLLLPVEILLFGYTLLFLRQFGSDWDVWTTLEAPAMQTSPPSAPVAREDARPPLTPPAPDVPRSSPPSDESPQPPLQT